MLSKFVFSSVLFGLVTFTNAAPITFTNSEYSTTVFAGVDSSNGQPIAETGFDASPPSEIPLDIGRQASLFDAHALARASADLGKLSVSTSVSTVFFDDPDHFSSADASSNSRFFGTIDSIFGGSYQLAFNFVTGSDIVGLDSFTSPKLAITINSSLNDLYSKICLTSCSLTDFTFSLAPGTKALFDVTLIGGANSTSGSAANTASVDFAINAAVNGVPEPHESMLLLLGGLVMYSFIRRERRRAGTLLV